MDVGSLMSPTSGFSVGTFTYIGKKANGLTSFRPELLFTYAILQYSFSLGNKGRFTLSVSNTVSC